MEEPYMQLLSVVFLSAVVGWVVGLICTLLRKYSVYLLMALIAGSTYGWASLAVSFLPGYLALVATVTFMIFVIASTHKVHKWKN